MRRLLAALLLATLPARADVVVVGHPDLPPLDVTTVQRIFSGKVVDVGGVRVTPVNLPAGNPLRERFLRLYLEQDEDKYTAYWTVRRYVGKGTPPQELHSAADVLHFVATTPGAIGYVEARDAAPGVRELARR